MNEQKIHYEPHPVSPARKAELRAQGLTIVDAIYAPKEQAQALATTLPPEGMQFTESSTEALAPIAGDSPSEESASVGESHVEVQVEVAVLDAQQAAEVAAAVATGVKQVARNRARNA